jgi:hypothetical protein
MDLMTLYTPAELAETRRNFLNRILTFFEEEKDLVECAAIVGHKLHGTGGNLGLNDLSKQGARLRQLAENDRQFAEMKILFETISLQVRQTLKQLAE